MDYLVTTYTISDVMENIKSKRFKINKDYQRNPNLWPKSAQTYFIDTLLEGFPYPQIYLYQNYDKQTKMPVSEIIDGQQRITSILNFCSGELKLSKESPNYSGKIFINLDDDIQQKFLMSKVEAVVITMANKSELLEMFRRMNSYTLPLNNQEKRNAQFQGGFKWFINDLSDRYSGILENFGVLTSKQIVRMLDQSLLSELCLSLSLGIINKSETTISSLYKRLDDETPTEEIDEYNSKISNFIEMVAEDLPELKNNKLFVANTFHDFFIASTHLKYGIPKVKELTGIDPIGNYYTNLRTAIDNLQTLSHSVEIMDENSKYSEFIKACKTSTTKQSSRIIKVKYIAKALSGQI